MWARRSSEAFGPVAGFGAGWGHIDFDRHNRNPLDHEPYEGRTGSRIARVKMPAHRGANRRPTRSDPGRRFHVPRATLAVARTEAGIPTLVLTPDPEFGLELEHVHAALAFAAKLRDGQSSNAGAR